MKPPVPNTEMPQTLLLRGYGRRLRWTVLPQPLASARDRPPSTYRFGTTPAERRRTVRQHSGTGVAGAVGVRPKAS